MALVVPPGAPALDGAPGDEVRLPVPGDDVRLPVLEPVRFVPSPNCGLVISGGIGETKAEVHGEMKRGEGGEDNAGRLTVVRPGTAVSPLRTAEALSAAAVLAFNEREGRPGRACLDKEGSGGQQEGNKSRGELHCGCP